MTVERLTPDLDDAWSAFVAGRADAQPFHGLAWRTVLRRGYGFDDRSLIAVEREEGRLAARGVLPLFLVDRPVGRPVLLSAPQAVAAGPLARDAKTAARLIEAARRDAEALGVDYLELRGDGDWMPGAGTGWHRLDRNAVFRRALPADPAEVLGAIPRKQRAAVRNARKQGVAVVRDAGPGRFYPLYARSVQRLGSPVVPYAYITAILDAFGADAEILTAEHEGRALASVLSLRHRGWAMPYHAGSLPAAAGASAYPALYAAAMERAVDQGLTGFDFGRSQVGSGAYAFKKNFGFAPTPLPSHVTLIRAKALPDMRPDNPRLAPILAVWRRLPAGVADRLGPWVSRQVV